MQIHINNYFEDVLFTFYFSVILIFMIISFTISFLSQKYKFLKSFIDLYYLSDTENDLKHNPKFNSEDSNSNSDNNWLQRLLKLLNNILQHKFLYSFCVIVITISIIYYLRFFCYTPCENYDIISYESVKNFYLFVYSLLTKLKLLIPVDDSNHDELKEILFWFEGQLNNIETKKLFDQASAVVQSQTITLSKENLLSQFVIDFSNLSDNLNSIKLKSDLNFKIYKINKVCIYANDLYKSGLDLENFNFSIEEKKQIKYIYKMSLGIEKAFHELISHVNDDDFHSRLLRALKSAKSFCNNEASFMLKLLDSNTKHI